MKLGAEFKFGVVAIALMLVAVAALLASVTLQLDLSPYYRVFGGFCAGIFFVWVAQRIAPKEDELEIRPTAAHQVLAKKDYKKEYQNLQDRYALVVEGTNDGIWDWDIPRNRIYWSERAFEVLGVKEDLPGEGFKALKSLMHAVDMPVFEKALQAHLISDVPFNLELKIRQIDGETYKTLLFRGKVKRDEKERPYRMAGSITDISRRKKVEEELAFNAYHDALTGLDNRKLLMDKLDRIIRKASARKDYIFAVLVLDLDRFKQINESFGSLAGDELLRQVAQRLEYCRRSSDSIARVGGDEFAVLLEDIHHAGDATNVASRIQLELKQPFNINNQNINVQASMGIAFNNNRDENNEVILANAYTVLKKAKEGGRNRCEVFSTGMREKALEKYKLERELKDAIENEELMLMYQPIVRPYDGSVAGFEALVRWSKSDGILVSPADFIPMAEESGLILPMGEWVLNTACRQTRKWVDQGFEDVTVAVNFSGRQFVQQNLTDMVGKALRNSDLPPGNLKVEVTETTAMSSVEQTLFTLKYLNEMGVQISIDDFGTGYSSLSYLKSYPIDFLKIDRSFIKDIPNDKDDMAITSTIIAMANNLGLRLIAEGVENQEQVDYLLERNCDYVQGYFFSKPLTPEDATQILQQKYVEKVS